jgi:DNA-binding MarR family transcriptional regulator
MTPTDLPPLLKKLTRQMHTLQTRYLDHLGLGMGQSLILREIMTHYGINEAQVSILLKLDKSTVTRAVKRLVEAGYVHKKPNPADRRSHHLLSTNMAKVLKSQFDMADQSLAEALLKEFNEEDTEMFAKYLRRASANVHHVLHSPPVSWFKRFYNLPPI